VTQRVNASGSPAFGSLIGSIVIAWLKKSRVWSIAMMTMTRPRSMSMDVRRYVR